MMLPAVTAAAEVPDLPVDVVERIRIATIDSHLARDPNLAALIAQRPGLRAPGDWERETVTTSFPDDTPARWRPWNAYALQHLRMAAHARA